MHIRFAKWLAPPIVSGRKHRRLLADRDAHIRKLEDRLDHELITNAGARVTLNKLAEDLRRAERISERAGARAKAKAQAAIDAVRRDSFPRTPNPQPPTPAV